MPLTIAPGSSAEVDEAHTPSFDDAINRLLSKAHEDNEAAAKCASGEMAAKVTPREISFAGFLHG